jgi:UPF0042 nucleotide-binding protein
MELPQHIYDAAYAGEAPVVKELDSFGAVAAKIPMRSSNHALTPPHSQNIGNVVEQILAHLQSGLQPPSHRSPIQLTRYGESIVACGSSSIGDIFGGGDGGPDIDVVLVTGLSGAGRGTAAKVLEDLGWYVADNLPPELIARMVDLGLAAGSRITQLAVVMDVRSRGFTGDLDLVRQDLATRNIAPRVLFMEASDDILVRRYENNRRSHPLQGNQTLAEGIAAERTMLAPVRAAADLIIDTSALSVPALRTSIESAFGGEAVARTSVTVESFGFKYGLPMDADMVMDVRFLPNPHWVDELRPQTGQSPAVRDYVLAQPGATEFLQTYHQLLRLVADGYIREGKRYMTVAIGCTGGKHRSVAIAEALAGLLTENPQLSVRVLHRDLGRE